VSVEAARAFDAYQRARPELISPALTAFMEEGRRNETRYAEAQERATTARAGFDHLMAEFDALVLPAATGVAPKGLASTGDASFSLFLSLLGPPCATIPGFLGRDGMPIGIQMVGRRGADEALLALVEDLAPLFPA